MSEITILQSEIRSLKFELKEYKQKCLNLERENKVLILKIERKNDYSPVCHA